MVQVGFQEYAFPRALTYGQRLLLGNDHIVRVSNVQKYFHL